MVILNRQLHDKSCDSDSLNPLATAFNAPDSNLHKSQFNNHEPSVFDSIQSTSNHKTNKQSGLETLRKV